MGNFIRRIGLPLIDAGLILLSFWLMKNIWNANMCGRIFNMKDKLLWIAFPAYTVFYLITAYYAGLYDRWYKRSELMSSTLVATIILLAGLCIASGTLPFFKGILLFGSLLAFVLISLLRWMLIRDKCINQQQRPGRKCQHIIIASPQEYQQTVQLIKDAGLQERILGR